MNEENHLTKEVTRLRAENAELRRQVARLSQALEKALREGIKIPES